MVSRLAPDAEAIVQLYREGASLADLGIRWHCHSNTIKRFLVSQDVVLRRSRPKRGLDEAEIVRMLDEGFDAHEVARMFKVHPETLAEFLVAKCAVIASNPVRRRR
ncbi:hypothetical protein KRR38_02990 [Novosphingobium sp. G106]|uniref:hypothetical protein n=1 Tax=Novosphingobium sp. G106 TaxID=2849500 RepID=UPI001C2DE666|nr:hypothetical protein [Novosphingobium sp. G106]MBV1686663.1 hypothetical protein [Novosphingobium sp. G106]